MATVPVTVTVNNENLQFEEEFWAEAAQTKQGYEDEEQKGNVTDEGELEADWLSEVGLGEWTQQWRSGKSLPENDIGPAVQKLSLKPHQADALRKRVKTLNATLKRKRTHRRPPDVRNFFQNEQTESKDMFRSGTPDSIESNEFRESPPRRASSPNIHGSASNSADELDDQPVPNPVPNFVTIFSDHARPRHHFYSSSSSPPGKSKATIFKTRFPTKVGSSVTGGEIASNTVAGIEMLQYHNVGTVYMKGYLPAKKVAPPTPMSNQNGFTAELNRINESDVEELDEQLDERPISDPCGPTRLSDLSEEDNKTIRPIILMELTAQCDHLSISVRKRKPQRSSKKEETNFSCFGTSLETLLAKDKSQSGENHSGVPVVFDKLLGHLWKRSICEQGLLRMAGQKAKINDLRATFESSLYSEPEQVDATMEQCSSHDVANLLKQFLRELPIPLLGYEYIDTLFEVCDKLKDRNLENCLRLLILLLPLSHQAVLKMLLEFLRELIRNSEKNKMTLKNVSLIVAPNLVPMNALSSQNKELSRAATWVKMTQTLIKFGPSLFIIPSDLLSQLRQINERAKAKRAKARNNAFNSSSKMTTANNNPASVKSTGCSNLLVSAPQLGFPEVNMTINAGTTAGDVVLILLEEAEKKVESLEQENALGHGVNINNGVGRRRPLPKAQDLTKGMGPNLSCLLSKTTADVILKTHALYEIGGNIGFRRVDPSALLPAVCRENPGANWVLRCKHRNTTSN